MPAAETYRISIVIEGKDHASRPLRGVGGALRDVGKIAAGILAARAFEGIARGIMNTARAALAATANYERLGLALQNLSAREFISLNRAQRFAEWMQKSAGATKQQVERYVALRQEYRKVGEQLQKLTAAGRTNTQAYKYLLQRQEQIKKQITQTIPGYDKLSDAMKKAALGGLDMGDALRAAVQPSKELLKWAIQLAIHSPFSTKGVVVALKTAMAYGFTMRMAKTLTQAMIDFTAATGASGDVMQRVALALGQIKAKGKLAGQEILQLVNAGVPVNDILEQMGYTLKDVSKGAVSAKEFIAAFTKYMQTNFAGAAERQTNAWAGLLNTFGDIKELGLKNLFQGMFDALKPLAVEFSNWLQDKGLQKLHDMGARIGNITKLLVSIPTGNIAALSGLFQKWHIPHDVQENLFAIVDALSKLKQGDYAGAWGRVTKAMQGFAQILGRAGGSAMHSLLPPKVLAGLKTFWVVLKGIGHAIARVLEPAWHRLAQAFRHSGERMKQLGFQTAHWKRLLEGLGKLIGGALLVAVGLLVGAINGVAKGLEYAAPFIVAALNGIGRVVDGLIQTLTGFVNLIIAVFTGGDVKGAVKQLTDGVTELVEGFAQTVAGLVNGLVQFVIGLVQGLVEGVIGFFQSLYDELVGHSIIPEMMDAILAVIAKGLEAVLTTVANWVLGVIGHIVALRDRGVALVRGFAATVWTTIRDKFAAAREAAATAFEEAKKAIATTLATIVSKVQEKVDDIKRILDFADKLRAIGGNLIRGLWDGMKAIWQSVENWLADKAGKLLKIVRAVTGTNSPSRKFAEIGEWLMEGLALGIQRASFRPQIAVAQAAQGVAGRATSQTWNINFHYGNSPLGQDDIIRSVNVARFLAGAPA